MSCDTPGKTDNRIQQFNRIKLLDDITYQIIMFGMQYGCTQLMDKVDLSCGAIPEGEFEQVIDLSAPHQFLKLYMQIAEKRFAMAVTEMFKMTMQFKTPVLNFLKQTGMQMQENNLKTVDDAFDAVNFYVLDGMPCDETKKVISKNESEIVWEKAIDSHEDAWTKAEGDLNTYYELQQSFINGILSASNFTYKVEDNCRFYITKNN